jgi:hypothetical protein
MDDPKLVINVRSIMFIIFKTNKKISIPVAFLADLTFSIE